VNVVVKSDRADGTSSAVKAPLAGPRGYQHGEVHRSSPNGRNPSEADQADQERDLPPEQVGEPATEWQQAAERETIGGDHPLAVSEAEVERFLRRRKRDVHHSKVEDHHQLCQANDAQNQLCPFSPFGSPGDLRLPHDPTATRKQPRGRLWSTTVGYFY
jgi:hypothetical protein